MNYNSITQSKQFRRILIRIGIFVIVLTIFQAGEMVGYRKALYSRGLGDNYARAFGNDMNEFMGGLPNDHMMNSHGSVGKIVRITLPTFVVADKDNTEKVITIESETQIRRFRNTLQSGDLKIGDFVVVLGEPDEQATIDARLIRVIPPPTDMMSGAATTSTSTKF